MLQVAIIIQDESRVGAALGEEQALGPEPALYKHLLGSLTSFHPNSCKHSHTIHFVHTYKCRPRYSKALHGTC